MVKLAKIPEKDFNFDFAIKIFAESEVTNRRVRESLEEVLRR